MRKERARARGSQSRDRLQQALLEQPDLVSMCMDDDEVGAGASGFGVEGWGLVHGLGCY